VPTALLNPHNTWTIAGAHQHGCGSWNSDYCTNCTHGIASGLAGFQNEAFIKHIAGERLCALLTASDSDDC